MATKVADYQIEYTKSAPYEVISTKWLSKYDVATLKMVEEMVELFYNTHQFETTVKILERKYDSAYRMYYDLAMFYEEEKLELKNPTRMYRYEAILSFVQKKYPEIIGDVKKALTMDYYLREKAKSRPSFAEDLKKYEKEIREISSNWAHKQIHVDVFNDGFIVFDYANRDPLTNNAKITEIDYLQCENDLL